jgi:type I restriction enzyme R subunit
VVGGRHCAATRARPVRLRDLVQHIDKTRKRLVYSDFEDDLGTGSTVDLPQIGAVDFQRFKRKARHFLLEQQDTLVLQKLRRGRPLTALDLQQLEDMLLAAGIGDRAQIGEAAKLSDGLGRFIRSLIGLERPAVAEAFNEFLDDTTATADQIEFIEMIIDHLTERGSMDPGLLYESPFTDVAPQGPNQVFEIDSLNRLVETIRVVNDSAVAG